MSFLDLQLSITGVRLSLIGEAFHTGERRVRLQTHADDTDVVWRGKHNNDEKWEDYEAERRDERHVGHNGSCRNFGIRVVCVCAFVCLCVHAASNKTTTQTRAHTHTIQEGRCGRCGNRSCNWHVFCCSTNACATSSLSCGPIILAGTCKY